VVGLRRVAATIALAALLVLGAAGLSGHITLDDCMSRGVAESEGTYAHGDARRWPPGYECVYYEPIATEADGRFVYTERPTTVSSDGSVSAFLGTLVAGALLWLLAARSRPHVPAALRLTAATALAFAAVGAGAWVGGVVFLGLFTGWMVGVPLAYVADRSLRPGRGRELPLRAGAVGAAVAAVAVPAAGVALLFGLGIGAFVIVLVAVALLGALPRRLLSGMQAS
jgi:hypothetical protein